MRGSELTVKWSIKQLKLDQSLKKQITTGFNSLRPIGQWRMFSDWLSLVDELKCTNGQSMRWACRESRQVYSWTKAQPHQTQILLNTVGIIAAKKQWWQQKQKTRINFETTQISLPSQTWRHRQHQRCVFDRSPSNERKGYTEEDTHLHTLHNFLQA